MTLRWPRTILNPPLDLPYRGPVEYEGEVDMEDYPWILKQGRGSFAGKGRVSAIGDARRFQGYE